MAKPVKIDCPSCLGKGKKIYPGKNKPTTCTYCAGDKKVEVWK